LGAEPRAFRVRRVLLAVVLCATLGALGALAASSGGSAEPAAVRFVPPRPDPFDFALRDQDGRTTSLAQARGKVVALTFLYSTCWDLCPAEAMDIAAAMENTGGRALAYAVSVDPVGDTPEHVRQFIDQHALPAGFRYLTGTPQQLTDVWHAYGIVPIGASPEDAAEAAAGAFQYNSVKTPKQVQAEDRHEAYQAPEQADPPPGAEDPYPDTSDLSYRGRARHNAGLEYEHSAYVMLIDKRGVQRVGIPFEQLDVNMLTRDIRILQQEQ
jgi:cytochrome oxidase Cu insertion factor (SCO1/SenC/PrrC family)